MLATASGVLSVTLLGSEGVAHATGITEFPDNGSEQSGRGGAWVARASDPLAAFYNPAGLAGQPTRLILQSNVNFQKTCFTRLKATNDLTVDPDGTKPGQNYPKVCSSDGAALDPQVALTFHATDRIGIGFAPLLAPSAGASSVSFPEFVTTTSNGIKTYEPGPSRYLLTGANLLVLNPTIGIGAEIIDRLRVGASFQWGIASLKFNNAVSPNGNIGSPSATSDVAVQSKAHDYFVPGITAGAIFSPTDDFDIAGWYKWSDAIKATGDIQTSANYYTTAVATGNTMGVVHGDTSQPNCGVTTARGPASILCENGNNLHIKVAEPMEAKVGFRYHKRRSDVPYDEHVRDPIAQDVFDVEVDLTWANDSTFQNLQVRLPGTAAGAGIIPINGIPASAPPNDDIPHGYKDVYGIRLGGDYNVLRDQLALRAGGFLQSNGQNSQDQNVDFAGSLNGGVAAGATYRIHLSKEKANALEISLGYEHVFYVNETNDGPNGVSAIAGTACSGNATVQNGSCTPAAPTANTSQPYRTAWPVNLGTITNAINVLNVGLGYKF